MLGAAIALNLLFHIPLLIGVLLTAADTLLLLWFTRLGIRVIESFMLALIAVIGGCFCIEIIWAGWPVFERHGCRGLVPHLNQRNLYIAIGILGATVMPHNLYLHSALVQTRRIGKNGSRKTHGLPVQSDRFHHRAERRAAGECGDPDAGRRWCFSSAESW